MKKRSGENEKKNFQQWNEDEWRERLKPYTVEYPDEERINATIDQMRAYVPAPKRRSRPLHLLLQAAGREWLTVSPIYWGSSLLLFIIGCMAIIGGDLNPYLAAMAMAPVPFIIGMIEVFKSWQAHMNELELTTKYSLQEIVLSKMVFVGSFSLLLNVLATLVLPVFSDGIWLWKLILYWFTPFTVISAVTFLLASRIRNGYITVSVSLVIWAGAAYGITLTELERPWLEQVGVIYYLVLNGLAIALLIRQIRRFCGRGGLIRMAG
jgi:hypothetical protein